VDGQVDGQRNEQVRGGGRDEKEGGKSRGGYNSSLP